MVFAPRPLGWEEELTVPEALRSQLCRLPPPPGGAVKEQGKGGQKRRGANRR